MASSTSMLKRLVVGRPFRSDQSPRPAPLPKRVALPVFAADPLSSVAYAPAQILMALSAAGGAAFVYAPWAAGGVVLVLLVVVASYRQTVRAFPTGGGDYEVAATTLGPLGGLTIASALLVDYMLTVAVSVAAAVDHLGAIGSPVTSHRTAAAVAVVAVLVAVNLRGVRPHRVLFAVPTYAFLAGMAALVGWGLWRLARGDRLTAPSADLEVSGMPAGGGLAGLALVVLLMRAFASGSVALTGIQTLANRVPSFKPPKPRNAASALLTVGLTSGLLLLAIVALARLTGLQYVEDPASQIAGASADYVQPPVTAQLVDTVFDGAPVAAALILAVTALVLVFAANTTFDGFPMLGAMLAADRYLPRQLHTRGDRLAFSNGILLLGAGATVLVVVFRADVVSLIHLYIVGVFAAFTLSQAGMVRHWNRVLRTEPDPATRRRYHRARAIQLTGAVLTGAVLGVVLVAKFNRGAWLSIVVMAVLYLLMRAIRGHYDTVAEELTPEADKPVLPARNHAVVLVSKLHLPTMRALAYAKATRPDTLTAVTVSVDPAETRLLAAEWEGRALPVPLTVIDSPYREITRPVVEYVKSIRRSSPRDVVTVFIPEYVVGHWWENLLHNQSALRLKSRLIFEPGVMVTSVPWQLASSAGKRDRMIRAPRSRDVPDFERAPED